MHQHERFHSNEKDGDQGLISLFFSPFIKLRNIGITDHGRKLLAYSEPDIQTSMAYIPADSCKQ
jgi:hypothetical protein